MAAAKTASPDRDSLSWWATSAMSKAANASAKATVANSSLRRLQSQVSAASASDTATATMTRALDSRSIPRTVSADASECAAVSPPGTSVWVVPSPVVSSVRVASSLPDSTTGAVCPVVVSVGFAASVPVSV